jgi:Putative 2OG-Fe(II) oxygenase
MLPESCRSVISAVEYHIDIVKVTGSIPVPTTKEFIMIKEISQFVMPMPGVLSGKLSEDLFRDLKKQLVARSGEQLSANDLLIGAIQRQVFVEYDYRLQDSILVMFDRYVSLFGIDIVQADITSLWANYQQRYEYNPLHHHDGIVSFVIWVDIPYDVKEEQDFFPNRGFGQNTAAAFEFTYSGLDGRMLSHQIPVSKQDEGKILMFPASLKHQVYPFMTTDGVRISVAGNIG